MVKTYEPLPVLREKCSYIFRNGSFMIAEIFPNSVDGLLPREAWEWFSHSHGQLSLADFLAKSQFPPPDPGGGLNALTRLLSDPTKK
jgi:hypothetical protein